MNGTGTRRTPARQAALETVAAGLVKRVWPAGHGKAYFIRTDTTERPRQQAYDWLAKNGLICGGPITLGGTQYMPTEAGVGRLKERGE